MGTLRTAIAAFCLVASFSAQNVTLVYWQIPETPITSYGVLLQCGFSFFGMFVVCALAFGLYTGDWSVFRVSDNPEECRIFVRPFAKGGKGRLTHAQLLGSALFLSFFHSFFRLLFVLLDHIFSN